MKIIRVFPRRTNWTPIDDYAFVGDPPMNRPPADEVHISTTFTWDIEESFRLLCAWGQYYPRVYLFGPAFGGKPDDFISGRYISHGVTFTSYGCNSKCKPCLVWQREGKLWEKPDFPEGTIIQDNNLLQCSSGHIDRVIRMLKQQCLVSFSGGLEAQRLTDRFVDQLHDIDIFQLFFACDNDYDLPALRKALSKLEWLGRDKYGLINKVRCYVLLAYEGETISQGTRRLEQVFESGALPFAQLYQPPGKYIDYSKEWRDLARTWSRPAVTKAAHKEFVGEKNT